MVFWMLHGKDPMKINRLAARLVDYLLFFLICGVASLFLPFLLETYFYYFFALAVPILWIPIEALCISLFKTTPGKALFGITIHDFLGAKLTYLKALRRAAFIPPRPGVIRQVSLSLKRRLSGLLIALACIGLSLFGNALTRWSVGLDQGMNADGWVQYYSQDAGFSVQFPTDPKEESKRLEIPSANKVLDYQELTSKQNKNIHYSVSYMDFPKKWKWAGNGTLLKGALDAIVKHLPNTALKSREFSYHQNQRSIDFLLKQGETEVKGRLIIVGTKLYKLTISYPASVSDKIEDSPFFSSFDLNG
jgi:uncharacterized RDD family membrane protein YckC